MEVLKCIETRQSIRAFTSKRIPKSIMKKILKAASHSPSYGNTQPWEVAVVTDKKKDELKALLMNLATAQAPAKPDIPMCREWPAGMDKRYQEHGADKLNTLGIARSDAAAREKVRLMNFEFYGAPCAVFLFIDGSLKEWSTYDTGAFVQTLVLAAHSFGVESCLQASVTSYAPEIKKFLGFAESKKLIISISMGYADQQAVLNTYRGPKLAPDTFTRWYE